MSSISKKIKKKEYELTRGFFQLLAENNADRLKPVVQIINSRPSNNGSSIGLRLSDGTFSFGAVFLKDNAIKKFELYELEKSQSVIKLIGFCSNIANNEKAKRVYLYIFDFELLEKDSPIIGTPKPHSGISVIFLALKDGKVEQGPLNKLNSQLQAKEVIKVAQSVKSVSSENDASIVPIVSISPNILQWKIIGTVTEKSEIRYFDTPKGRGEVFDFFITDKEGTEIRVSCFGYMAYKYNEFIELYSSYTIKGNNKAITLAKKGYNNTGHEYEIVMRDDVKVTRYKNEITLPPQKIDRVNLSKIKMFLGEYIDVIAVVHNMEEPVNVNGKNGVLNRMRVSLIDESGSLVTLTIWGDSCDEFTEDLLHKPIILKNVAVTEFSGIFNLTFGFRSRIIPSEDVDIVEDISEWYTRERGNIQISNISSSPTTINNNVTIHSVIVSCLNDNNIKEGYFNVIGRVGRVRENLVYKACLQKDCREKVVLQNGKYYCSKCNITLRNFKYVLMVIFKIYDHTGSHWVVMLNDVAERLLKKKASKVGGIIKAHGELEGCNIVVSNLVNTLHDFKVRFKIRSYKGRTVAKWCCVDVKPVSLTKYADCLKEWCKNAEEFCSKYGI
uniref:Replication protein A subunit n=1 Tax=Strongyloides papillosus TaxID=174720 RepID=A0A0N5CGM6_STREA